MQVAYLGATCLALGAGVCRISCDVQHGAPRLHPLNFTSTLVGADCAAVVAVKPRRVHLPGEEIQLFSGGSAFALALGRLRVGCRGDVLAVGRGVSKIAVGGYPVGALLGRTAWWCRWWGVSQYFYRVDRGAAELLASWLTGVGLSVPFHVGCGLAVADGLKRTAVAVGGNYTIRHLDGAGGGV